MTKPSPHDWHAVALYKLTNVMGEAVARALVPSILADLGMPAIGSPEELRRFAAALSARGGFEAAVGGLLDVHAVMYGRSTSSPVRQA